MTLGLSPVCRSAQNPGGVGLGLQVLKRMLLGVESGRTDAGSSSAARIPLPLRQPIAVGLRHNYEELCSQGLRLILTLPDKL